MSNFDVKAMLFAFDQLGDTYLRSLLYHPNFTTEFRKGAQ